MGIATFYLTREVSTNKYTIGTLYEPITGFRCRTLERPINKIDSRLKANYCLPEGEYRMRIESDGLRQCLAISTLGIYHMARFTPELRIEKTRSGCICVGTRVEGDALGGGAKAYDALSELTETIIDEVRFEKKARSMFVHLVIREQLQQSYVVPEQKMLKRTEWDMIDDEEEDI